MNVVEGGWVVTVDWELRAVGLWVSAKSPTLRIWKETFRAGAWRTQRLRVMTSEKLSMRLGHAWEAKGITA